MAVFRVISCVLCVAFFIDANMGRMLSRMARPAVASNITEDQWFKQPLDHFDITNNITWKQRYHVMDKYYEIGGPAFLVVEGEWTSVGEDLNSYAASSYAGQLNGIIFQLEHRFYGKSKPTSDVSLNSLRYLTVDQALADAAYFIAGMNEKYKLPENTKWVTFGTSYGGTLSAWMRDKYPHLVYASVAYSAPLLAKLNFVEYKSVVRDVIKRISKECLNLVKEAHSLLKQNVKDSKDLADITKKFKLCDPLDNRSEQDIQSLLDITSDNVCSVVQYNHIHRTSIEPACNILKNASIGNLLDRYGDLQSHILKDNRDDCLEYKYLKRIEKHKNDNWESEKVKSGERQWMYQTCTEMGFYQTSISKTDLFNEDLPLSYFTQICTDIFGEKFNKKFIDHGVKLTNIDHGGTDIRATRVAYVFGKQDPWHPLGITKTKIPESPAIFIEGESHMACEYTNLEKDSDVYKKGCKEVESIVTKWITG